MTEPDLLPCPFCGSHHVALSGGALAVWIRCAACSAEGPPSNTKSEAADAWNGRASPPSSGDDGGPND